MRGKGRRARPGGEAALGPRRLAGSRPGAIAQTLLPDLDTEAPRETTPLLGHCAPGVIYDPGGKPRDRNTPKIETRRISDLQTLGSHET